MTTSAEGMSVQCRKCGKKNLDALSLPKRPIVNRLNEKEDTNTILYEMTLLWCDSCNFLQLHHQIPARAFYETYSTPSSWKEEPHLNTVVEQFSLFPPSDCSVQSTLEIGCNDGKLLGRLLELGNSRLLGVEPSWLSLGNPQGLPVEIIPDYFSDNLALKIRKNHGAFDNIVTRHVLEHVQNLHDFILGITRISKPGTKLIVEVPDAITFFKEDDLAFWEEHLNYFLHGNLVSLFREYNFEHVSKKTFLFSGRAQLLEFRYKGEKVPERVIANGELEEPFNFDQLKKSLVESTINFLKLVMAEKNQGRLICVWGVGSRSLGTLYTLGAANLIDFYIDDNQNKVGKFVPGTNKSIRNSDFLREEQHSNYLVLLGVNYENEAKIIQKFSGSPGNFRSLLSPSPLLWSNQFKNK